MTSAEFFAGLSVLVSFAALIIAIQQGRKNLGISYAGWEMQAQQYIDATSREFESIAVKLAADDGDAELMLKVLESSRQRMLNAYDAGCQAYLDEKIDRERFKRAQQRNIFRLFDKTEEFPELEGRSTDYRALAAVYEEWRGEA